MKNQVENEIESGSLSGSGTCYVGLKVSLKWNSGVDKLTFRV